MYKILIIDDDWEGRKPSYETLLSSDFDLIFLEYELLDFSLIDDPTIDCIIVDLYLPIRDTEGNTGDVENNFRQVLRYINNKKPIILVSRKFSELASWVGIPAEYNVEVIGYFGWPEIFSPTGKVLNESIKNTTILRFIQSLNSYYRRTNSIKKPNDKITILAFSDLQFGDPNFSEDTLLSDIHISKYLIDNNIFPDLILICGDITYSGDPVQFMQAEEWILGLCSNIFPKSFLLYEERIIIVPGNHDVNLSLSLADIYKFNFAASNKKELFVKRKSPLNDYKTLSFYPFCDFAFRLTKDIKWIEKSNNLCWSNDRFINWGFKLIQLNSVSEIYYYLPGQAEIDESSIKQLGRDLTGKSGKNIYTIAISHNGPEDLGYQRGLNSDKRVKNLFALINSVGINLFIHGHRHTPSSKYKLPYKGKFTNNIEYLMVGTMNLNVVRKHDSFRSFSVIELIRENRKVVDSNVRIFGIEEQNIEEKKY
jgi:Icc-related predicted phosphoesterase